MRASWIFLKSDVISNTGVIVAGLLVMASGSRVPDLVVGSIVAVVVLRGGVQILAGYSGDRKTRYQIGRDTLRSPGVFAAAARSPLGAPRRDDRSRSGSDPSGWSIGPREAPIGKATGIGTMASRFATRVGAE